MTIYEYDLQGRETYEGDGTYPIRFTYYDEGRMTGMTTYRDESEPGDTTAWTHDPATGLLIQKLYDDGKGPSYSYLSGSSLVSGMTASTGHAWSRSYEPHRNLLSFVENKYGSVIISRFDYENDEIGRRTAISRSGTAFDIPVQDAYGYNTRSEVTSARRTLADTPSQEVRGFSYDYAYDPIGNRTSATEYDHEDNALVESYTANALNQYTQRTVPGHAGVRGSATNTATVTVNGNATWRLGEYFYGGDTADNAGSAVMKELETLAVVNLPGTNTPDVVQSVTGRVFVAQSPEAFTHDDDGNLTQDGRFVYTWDGENRLVSVETRSDLPASVPRVKVTYAYDHQSRRIEKEVSQFENESWTVAESRNFLYDGWNMIREFQYSNIPSFHSSTNSYVWGLDLSGSLQGAGGVGGLLAEVQDGVPYFATYDANGNVTDYTDSFGTLAAHYEYSPFGETLIQSGFLADTFAFRFSTKYWENEANLYYYGYRFYSPELGRWLSRDPIGEAFQRHLYGFVKNNGVRYVDLLGLLTIYIGGAGERTVGDLDYYRKVSGCDISFDNKQHAEIEKRIREEVKAHPCEPIILVGHSYGGDTAMDVAAKLQSLECLCLYVITLDPVSHFDPDTWFWQNPATPNITEWINVYQPAGAVDYIAAVPVLGWAIGGIWSGIGAIFNNHNMVATGGGQWNNISGPDYRIDAGDLGHGDVGRMMDLKFKDSSGREISVRDYMNELQGRNCCEK